MNKCINCGKIIKKQSSKRCRDCYIKWASIPQNNPNYKQGQKHQKGLCLVCKKEIHIYQNLSGKCKKCAQLIRVQNHCIICNQVVSYNAKKCRSCASTKHGKFKNNNCLDCNKKISARASRCKSCSRRGELHFNFIDGKSKEPYPLEFFYLKELIRKRDNYICQNCGMTEEEHLMVKGRVLDVHHIDYDTKNNNQSNLITLCHSCNVKANYNRDYCQDFYQNKNKEIIHA